MDIIHPAVKEYILDKQSNEAEKNAGIYVIIVEAALACWKINMMQSVMNYGIFMQMKRSGMERLKQSSRIYREKRCRQYLQQVSSTEDEFQEALLIYDTDNSGDLEET